MSNQFASKDQAADFTGSNLILYIISKTAAYGLYGVLILVQGCIEFILTVYEL